MKLLTFFLALSLGAFANLNNIKKEIMDLAQSFQGQMDEDGSKQKQIELLVDELLKEVPNYTMQEKATRALGVWNQIWGPYAFDDSNRMPPGIDHSKIYQYISNAGFYYNFAEYKLLGFTQKSYLRGVYEIKDDRISVEFTNLGFIRQNEVDYTTIGDDLEAGAVRTIPLPRQFPPAGIKGALIEVYADDEIRINYGVVGGNIDKPAIFVMKRIK